jgi:hypothetical protein
MHKLVILIQPSETWRENEENWPKFLRLVESMPGLRRESTSRVENFLFGAAAYIQSHELFFDTLPEAEIALASPQGKAAGKLLQQMTGGNMVLFLADHKEDNLANIQKYRPQNEPNG